MLGFNGGTIGIANTVFTGTKSNDPNYSNVSLLLNGNGTNGSTTFTDSSSYGHTVTPNGNAQISTVQSKFGGASMYFDGSGDYLSLPNDQTSFDFGTGNFTIECWIYWPGGPGNIFSQRHAFDNNNTGMSWRTSTSNLLFFYGNGLGGFSTPSTSLPTNAWNHIALTRNGNTFTMWINGQSQATNTITATMIYYPPAIGRVQGVAAEYLNAYLDDFRITKGVARYTSNFEPPTAQLPGGETGTFASGLWTSSDHIKQIRNELWPGFVPSIVTDGLVVHLDAGNSNSYPGSGTTWYDLSGNGYNHTLTNAPLTTIDGVSCFNVSSSSRYIVDSGTTFTFGSSHTMIAWARPLADSQVGIWRTLWRTQPYDHPLLIQDGTNLIGYYDNNSNQFISYGLNTGTLGIENKWTMFTLVASGGSTTCYINNLSASGTVAYTTSGNDHDAFGNEGGGSQPFGYVSVAQIYNKALTPSEVTQNFDALKGRYGL
jgi:hypothetical protein